MKLQAYSEFIHSEQGYVIREALNYLFESDSTFQEFFGSRPKSDSNPIETLEIQALLSFTHAARRWPRGFRMVPNGCRIQLA